MTGFCVHQTHRPGVSMCVRIVLTQVLLYTNYPTSHLSALSLESLDERKKRIGCFPKKKILVEVPKMMKDQYFECRGSENVLRIKLAKVVVK